MNISKKTLLITLASISISGCFSLVTFEPFELVSVVDVHGLEKTVTYNSSRQWFSENFVTGESVVNYENANLGTIIGNGVSDVGTDPLGLISYGIHYSLRVDAKEGKLKVTTKINKFTNTDVNGTYEVVRLSQDRIDDAKDSVNMMVGSLRLYVQESDKMNW